MNRHNIGENHEHVTMTYFARSGTNKVVTESHDKNERWQWMTASEIAEHPEIGIDISRYALQALEEAAPKNENR